MTREEAFKEIDEAIEQWGDHCAKKDCEHDRCWLQMQIEIDVRAILNDLCDGVAQTPTVKVVAVPV